MPVDYNMFNKSLGQDDIEEQRLLQTWVEKTNDLEKLMGPSHGLNDPTEKPEKAKIAELKAQLSKVTERLGYDPTLPRPKRPTGRPKRASIPDPLPPRGTVLTTCLGESYKILGYAKSPRKLGVGYDYALYLDEREEPTVRNLVHLFTGMLADGTPFVTWPEDPRGYKPGGKVPMSHRRTLSKHELRQQREAMDADLLQHNEGAHRRY